MKIQKHDMPILGEFYNSLNSDRLYSRLVSFKLSEYIEELDDNRCIFNRNILNRIDLSELNKIMNKYQWHMAVNAETFIGYRPRYVILDGKEIFDYSFYHFSPIKYEETILKNGLKPKAQNNMEMYEPAVYLFSEYLYLKDVHQLNSIDTEICHFIDELKTRLKYTGKYSIYEIKFKNKNIELHMDPTYDYGCFVHRLILPQEIKLIKHY